MENLTHGCEDNHSIHRSAIDFVAMAKYAYCLLSLILAQLMYAQTPAYTEWKRGLTASLRTLWLDRGKVEFIDWWVTNNPPYPDSSGGSTYNTWQMAFNSFLNQNLYLGTNLQVVDAWLARNPPYPDPMVNVSFAWDADDPIYKVTHYRLYFGTQSGVYTQHVDVKTDTRVTILFFSGFTYYA